ncbi:MAG TPA: sigma-54 dependent transcriptional regulator [Myxococcota bacterium]|nr:sigma-54 dependent transcriptional regulator [Myxococcota bacterium]HRY96486.1 sigma-54 dependent transcriptional regulator [Myxococcota bacterium]
MPAKILIADDELNIRKVLAATLRREGYEVLTAKDGLEAIELLKGGQVQVVVTDMKMPTLGGLDVLRHVHEQYPRTPVIIITAHGTVDTAVEALKNGAFDYITKPFEQAELMRCIGKAVKTESLAARDVVADGPDPERYRMIGQSRSMQAIYEVIDKVAATPSTVLITGESGTGKELIAAALHYKSARRAKPFIKINCAAIPRELMESELFGHERGAFTGAVNSKPGRFELADGGTLFLDEIGEIPVEMQVKLLRSIQENEFERVGGMHTIHVDVRLVVATNRDLAKLVEEGKFREDLFYRLNVVPIRLPPLRERKEDIPLLVEHFLAKYNARLSRQVKGIQPAALSAVLNHRWPGNIRELENVIERALLFCTGEEIQPAELPPELLSERPAAVPATAAPAAGGAPVGAPAVAAAPPAEDSSMKDIVKQATAELEKDLILKALAETQGNVTQAAKKLKISRKSLQNKMKEFGLRDGERDAE